eukprot:921265-Prymnesium_polylepis.1
MSAPHSSDPVDDSKHRRSAVTDPVARARPELVRTGRERDIVRPLLPGGCLHHGNTRVVAQGEHGVGVDPRPVADALVVISHLLIAGMPPACACAKIARPAIRTISAICAIRILSTKAAIIAVAVRR